MYMYVYDVCLIKWLLDAAGYTTVHEYTVTRNKFSCCKRGSQYNNTNGI